MRAREVPTLLVRIDVDDRRDVIPRRPRRVEQDRPSGGSTISNDRLTFVACPPEKRPDGVDGALRALREVVVRLNAIQPGRLLGRPDSLQRRPQRTLPAAVLRQNAQT